METCAVACWLLIETMFDVIASIIGSGINGNSPILSRWYEVNS